MECSAHAPLNPVNLNPILKKRMGELYLLRYGWNGYHKKVHQQSDLPATKHHHSRNPKPQILTNHDRPVIATLIGTETTQNPDKSVKRGPE